MTDGFFLYSLLVFVNAGEPTSVLRPPSGIEGFSIVLLTTTCLFILLFIQLIHLCSRITTLNQNHRCYFLFIDR